MPSDRYVITDRQWSKIELHCLGKKTDPGRTGSDGRLFLEGVFWSEGMNATGPRECPNTRRGTMARPSRRIRQVEHGLPPVRGLGAGWCIRTYIQCVIRGARHGDGDDPLSVNVYIHLAGQRTELLSRFTVPLSAIEGNRLPGNGTGLKRGAVRQAIGQVEGRLDDQNPGPDRRLGQSRAVYADAGKSPRHGRRGPADQGFEIRRPAGPLSWFASKP